MSEQWQMEKKLMQTLLELSKDNEKERQRKEEEQKK